MPQAAGPRAVPPLPALTAEASFGAMALEQTGKRLGHRGMTCVLPLMPAQVYKARRQGAVPAGALRLHPDRAARGGVRGFRAPLSFSLPGGLLLLPGEHTPLSVLPARQCVWPQPCPPSEGSSLRQGLCAPLTPGLLASRLVILKLIFGW